MAATPGLDHLLQNASAMTGTDRERAFQEVIRLLVILVRARMDARMRARHESMDVCQSVAKSFVEDWQAGKVRFENEAALAGYLKTVVKNKLVDLSRHDGAARRGGGEQPLTIDHPDAPEPSAPRGTTASRDAINLELFDRIMEQFSEPERRLIDLRRRGLEWEQIAALVGEGADVLRKRWSRMQARVMNEVEEQE